MAWNGFRARECLGVLGVFMVATSTLSLQEPAVRLEVLGREFAAPYYGDFVLVNESSVAVYVLCDCPYVTVLERQDESTRKWQRGASLPCRGPGGAETSCEVPARSTLTMEKWWSSSIQGTEGGFMFRSTSGALLSLHGTFRLLVPYSLQPWTGDRPPARLLDARSEPFEMNPRAARPSVD